MNLTKLLGGALLGAVFVLSTPADADAQKRNRRARVVQLEEPIYVTGRLHVPGAFYILERSESRHELRELRRDMTREIVRSTRSRSLQ